MIGSSDGRRQGERGGDGMMLERTARRGVYGTRIPRGYGGGVDVDSTPSEVP